MNARTHVVLMVLLALCGARALAGDENKQPPASEAIAQAGHAVEKTAVAQTAAGAVKTTALPDSPSAAALEDPATRQKYLDAVGRYYEYRLSGFEFRSRLFEWQLFSSRVIFVIVILLVLAGIYFSAVQFHVALITARRASKHVEPAADAKTAAPSPFATQLEISAKGIIVNSSVLGVIVLALSLAFFYFYLVYVYPINDTL